MVGDAKRQIPELVVRNTTETFLCHSQSPSFAESRSPEKSVDSEKAANNYAGLMVREGREQKRQKLVSPTKLYEPAPKKARGIDESPESTENEAGQLAKENAKRVSSLLNSNVDINEMYRTLRSAASAIPCPKSLLSLFEESPSSLPEIANKCRYQQIVIDRQNAILNLFSRRFPLKLCSESLHLGVALLDQCLETMIVNKETVGDLAAVTMVIATKVEEINCLSLRDAVDCGLIENKTVAMIGILERMILDVLQYKVTVPTPLTFATYLLVHLDAPPPQTSLTNYLLELSLLDVQNRRHPSDVVAHAATCLTFAIAGDATMSSLKALQDVEIKLHKFCGIEMATGRSRDLMRNLAVQYLDAPSENHTIFREYSTLRRYAVSLYPFDATLQKALNIQMNTPQDV